MRLGTYNVEWFNALFDDQGRLLRDDKWSARHNVTRIQQADALGRVFERLDADAMLIVEAPDTSGARGTAACLKTFARHYGLRLNSVLTGFLSDTQQEIALFYDDRVVAAEHDPGGGPGLAPRFDKSFAWDIDVDGKADHHKFSKPPLEARVSFGERVVNLMGVHIKSKAPHGARSHDHAVQIAIANRRKQLAQCLWLRQRVDERLSGGEDVIVLGDFNDGPGLDEYEALFGRSGVEIVLGRGNGKPAMFDPHADARLDPRQSWSPATARFYNKELGVYFNALLDFIMVSNDLHQSTSPEWKIWHPFDDAACFKDQGLARDLLTASDHFPVTLDFTP